jgi:16S rRNA (guanine527-N7)-methyltransferase
MKDQGLISLKFDPQIILSKFGLDSKIKQYLDLLKLENKKINFVSRETSDSDFERLAAESLLPFEAIGTKRFDHYLDIGSGGGFPAIPIIMSAKIGGATLIERTKKKAAALERIAGKLGLKIRILDANFDECRFSEKFDLITLRLVKLTKPLLKRISQLLKSGGTFVYYSDFKESSGNELGITSYSYTTAEDSPVKTFTIFVKH